MSTRQVRALSKGAAQRPYAIVPFKSSGLAHFRRQKLGVRSYTDRLLWQQYGPICRQAKQVSLPRLTMASRYFTQSLSRRPAGGDSAHDFMRERLQDCISALSVYVAKRERSDVMTTGVSDVITTRVNDVLT